VQQQDAAVAVGVVLDGRDLGRHAVLGATEVDDPVALLVAAALVASGLAAVAVAPPVLCFGASSDFSGVVLVISEKSETVWNDDRGWWACACGVPWFYASNRSMLSPRRG
jgi:hypothetical protein